MSSLRCFDDLTGVTYRLYPSGRIRIDPALPEDHEHDDDDPAEAGETGPEWPAESGADEDESDDWIDDAMVMVGRAA